MKAIEDKHTMILNLYIPNYPQ